MSSGFVSGGTTDQPIQRDDEWLKAQQEVEASRRRREEESKQEGGKSLYEVLQQNKAAKQDAFEESIRLKNQFRNLDEDEVEFLDSVLESTRAREEAVKKETREQLELFRQQQEKTDQAFRATFTGAEHESEGPVRDTAATGEAQWVVNAGKRKRVKDKEILKGVKMRKLSSAEVSLVAPTVVQSSSNSAKGIIPGQGTVADPTSGCNRIAKDRGLGAINTESISNTRSEKAANDHVDDGDTATQRVENAERIGLVGYGSDDD